LIAMDADQREHSSRLVVERDRVAELAIVMKTIPTHRTIVRDRPAHVPTSMRRVATVSA